MLKKIKTKIIIIYSLVMVAFTSTLLLTVFMNERNQILELELEKSTEISRMHAEILSREFSQYIAILKMVSDSPEIKNGDQYSIGLHLQRLIKIGGGDFINAIFVDENLNLTDAKGNKSKVTNPLFLKGKDWDGKEYNIISPIYSEFEKKPVIIVAVPIRDPQNAWIGTIAVAVPLNIISKKLSFIKLEKGSYAWLADANGMVVSHPNERFILKVQLSTSESIRFPGFSRIFRKTQSQYSGYGHYSDAMINESKIVTFSKIRNLPGWILFVTTKESEIFHDIYKILYNILIISIILMLVFLFFIIKLSNKITRPLIQLTKDVKASVSSKNNDFKIINSDDEIGQLSKAFHETIQKIHEHTDYLEEKISARTRDISTKNLILKEKNNKLEDLASRDSLTQLYNRRAFSTLVDEKAYYAKTPSLPATLVVLDVDHFKKINDQFGHDIGDDILCRLAYELVNGNEIESIACRWGGEEFVILIPNATPDRVAKYMEALQERIAKASFDPVETLTFSAGLATMRPEEPFKKWFQRADKALYEAKASGRNHIIWG